MEIKCSPDSQIFSFKILFKKIIKYRDKEVEHFKVLIISLIQEQLEHRNIHWEKEYQQTNSNQVKFYLLIKILVLINYHLEIKEVQEIIHFLQAIPPDLLQIPIK
jgi:hypothetical protein